MENQCNITWTGRIVKEPIPRHFELFEYIGTNEHGEPIKVYVYRVVKTDQDNEHFDHTAL